eukprot:CAMPEP_0175095638 /NCGR_PEP_ID=MMETSP0086_2-20121207/4274_1 /TAXON_ID=136419 /ORGANISM="Unknown Unknown, Strain D1" /LENGTH=594 /DNA_ID=CAMNT_0016368923 /DNA_START=84 /DNA_END=1868 /DNA_ORIENTATION=-
MAPLPLMERGYSKHLYCCKKSDRFAYCNKKTIVLRSFADPTISSVFCGHKANVNVAAFSPNGEWIASGDIHGQVIVWNVKTGNIKADHPVGGVILDLAWDEEGKRIVAVGDGGNKPSGKAFTWDSGNAVGTLTGHTKRVIAVDIKRSRPYRCVTAGEDNLVVALPGPPFQRDHDMKEHTRFPNKVQFSPSGDFCVSAGSDGKIVVYDGKDLLKVREIEDKENAHAGAIYSFCFNSDGTKFVTCGSDKTTKVWDFEKGAVEATFTVGTDVEDQQMACLWHKDWILSVSLSGAINFFDPANPGAPSKVLHGHMGDISGLATDTDSKKVYSCDSAGKVCSWDSRNATWFSGKGHTKGCNGLALNADKTKLATVSNDNTFRWNDCKSQEMSDNGIALGACPNSVACGKSNPTLAAVGGTDKIWIINGDAATKIDLKYTPLAMAFSNDDSKLLVGGKNKTVYMYSVSGSELKEEFSHTQHVKEVCDVAFSPDGKYYTSCSGDNCIYNADTATNAIKNTSGWEYHRGYVNAVAWSPDGKNVASISNDLSVIIFKDTENFKSAKSKIADIHSVSGKGVAWLDANTLITYGNDNVIKELSLA